MSQKKVLIALPVAMLEQLDHVSHAEFRTRSDAVREAIRRYLDNFNRSQIKPLEVVNGSAPN